MDLKSDATAIVNQMLVRYFNAQPVERATLAGADSAVKSWDSIRQTLAANDLLFLADDFEKDPLGQQTRLVMTLAKFMKKDSELTDRLQVYYDIYLKELLSDSIDVRNSGNVISTVSGVTRGEHVITVKYGALGESAQNPQPRADGSR